MAELKTKPTQASVETFLNSVPDERKRQDSFVLLDLLKSVTGAEPVMWGDAIVGFGDYHYQYASGRENDWFVAGFSPRKQNLTLYSMGGFEPFEAERARLGKHKLGKGCLYINKLSDVDLTALRDLLARSVENAQQS